MHIDASVVANLLLIKNDNHQNNIPTSKSIYPSSIAINNIIMIAERQHNSYSNTAINELETISYCDFGFPMGEVSVEATMPRISSSKLDLRSSKLDEVIRAFGKVIDGNDITTSKLLKACRAHLQLMRTGGELFYLLTSRGSQSS